MRIILSRKGMDSGAGGMASPVLEKDGTMISLPIPEDEHKVKDGRTTYGQIFYDDYTPYSQIINDLSKGRKKWENKKCHVDPDLTYRYDNSTVEKSNWKPAFGQHSAGQGHLKSNNIDVGDLFLFYGWFRCARQGAGGKFSYVADGKMGPNGKHVIWGYMQIGRIVESQEEIRKDFFYHPHSGGYYTSSPNNVIYVPKEGELSFKLPDGKSPKACVLSPKSYGLFKYKSGCGKLDFDKKHPLDLTKEGHMNRSEWDLDWIKDENIKMTYHKNRLIYADGAVQSARRGQEFIIDPPVESEPKLQKWLEEIFQYTMD